MGKKITCNFEECFNIFAYLFIQNQVKFFENELENPKWKKCGFEMKVSYKKTDVLNFLSTAVSLDSTIALVNIYNSILSNFFLALLFQGQQIFVEILKILI